ncbi:hypothetical protein ACU635_50445 [[Actinomadura] parvosata]|uniref:hypothetical protein n=1 Tax=[Actinomadura] parvosata TaxID=1955412 RepID=UPI00406C0C4D
MSSDDQVTKPRPIRVPEVLWKAYGEVCDGLGTDRTKDLIAHMRDQITRHGNDQQRAAVDAADQEMADRRARMSPGRPRKTPARPPE